MTAVRMGEKLLHVGAGDPALFTALAGKVGLTGRACAVVESEMADARMQAAAAEAGVLVDTEQVQNGLLPDGNDSADVIVVDLTPPGAFLLALDQAARVALARDLLRVLRPGGRLVVVEREPRRLFGLASGHAPALDRFRAEGGAQAMLTAAGFHPTRVLADRDGQRYTEGLKVHHTAS
jgi:predicted methyltransferase